MDVLNVRGASEVVDNIPNASQMQDIDMEEEFPQSQMPIGFSDILDLEAESSGHDTSDEAFAQHLKEIQENSKAKKQRGKKGNNSKPSAATTTTSTTTTSTKRKKASLNLKKLDCSVATKAALKENQPPPTPEPTSKRPTLRPASGNDSGRTTDTDMTGPSADVAAAGAQEGGKSKPKGNSGQGVTYWCNDHWRTNSGLYDQLVGRTQGAEKLFYALGQGIFLDQPTAFPSYQRANAGGLLRMSLWFQNGIQKMQKSGGRFSVSLDFDALHLLKANLEDIERALRMCDEANFLGYSLHLGRQWYATVERDECSLNLRRWWILNDHKEDPNVELLPSRDGLKINYSQFKRFKEFLNDQLEKAFPNFPEHVFKCDRNDHDAETCQLCKPKGMLPMAKQIYRLLGTGMSIFCT